MLLLGTWNDRLASFTPASAELIERRLLRTRADWKFVMPAEVAVSIVERLTGDYALVGANTAPVALYRTLYFDTAQLDLFDAQRRGRRIRHKVRIRHYVERRLSNLEVKTRRSEMHTIKALRARTVCDDSLDAADQAFVRLHTGLEEDVLPQVWTTFRRITLVGRETEERVTIDLELRIGNDPQAPPVGDFVIFEVKQWPVRSASPVMSALRDAGQRTGWMSKYFVAIALTHPGIRMGGLGREVRALTRV